MALLLRFFHIECLQADDAVLFRQNCCMRSECRCSESTATEHNYRWPISFAKCLHLYSVVLSGGGCPTARIEKHIAINKLIDRAEMQTLNFMKCASFH